MNKPCYLVTTGEYSEYTVHAVFLDETVAKQYAKQINGDCEPCEFCPRFVNTGDQVMWQVYMDFHTGQVDSVCRMSDRLDDFSEEYTRDQASYGWRGTLDCRFCFVRAESEEGAVKAAADRLRQLKARGVRIYELFNKEMKNDWAKAHSFKSTNLDLLNQKRESLGSNWAVRVIEVCLPEHLQSPIDDYKRTCKDKWLE